jgi:hypothetical protein
MAAAPAPEAMTTACPRAGGVVLYSVTDTRVEHDATGLAVVAFCDGSGGEKLTKVPLRKLACPLLRPLPSAGDGGTGAGAGTEHGRGIDHYSSENETGDGGGRHKVVPVSLGLVPALLRSSSMAAIQLRVFSGQVDSAECARGVLEELRRDPGERHLVDVEEVFCRLVEANPVATARLGSLVLKWTDLPKPDGAELALALDCSGVCSGACLAVAQLQLWAGQSFGRSAPQVMATRALKASTASTEPLAPLSALNAPSVTGGFPSTL